ncbi:MAG: RHS repeat-associated core domain-containing protein [Candidatus Aenigmatarchaeota archaeon]
MPKQVWDSKVLWILVLATFTIVTVFSAYPVGFFAAQTAIGKSYIFANGQRVATINETGTLTYSHNDYLGSARLATSESAEQIMKYDNAPFGSTVTETGYSSALSSYKFTGKEQDSSGLYYYGARYYNPYIGRFTTVDPVYSPSHDEESPYVYAWNNPMKYVDPSGKQFVPSSYPQNKQQMGGYLAEQTKYFEGRIEPLLRKASYPEDKISGIKDSLRSGDMMTLNPWHEPEIFGGSYGAYYKKGFVVYSIEYPDKRVELVAPKNELGLKTFTQFFDLFDSADYSIFGTAHMVVSGEQSDIEVLDTIVHEYQHLLNHEAGITNQVEDEYLGWREGTAVLQNLGVDINTLKRSDESKRLAKASLGSMKEFYEESRGSGYDSFNWRFPHEPYSAADIPRLP